MRREPATSDFELTANAQEIMAAKRKTRKAQVGAWYTVPAASANMEAKKRAVGPALGRPLRNSMPQSGQNFTAPILTQIDLLPRSVASR